MRIVMFYHSLVSDWNHGNAHFLRGVAGELLDRGHDVRIFEPADSWSLKNLQADYGDEPLERFRAAYPMLRSTRYVLDQLDLNEALDGADVVIVHEWNDHDLVRRIGRHRARGGGGGGYRLLFHDTHHRAVTDAGSMAKYDLSHYDGVLAFGQVLRDLYLSRGWAKRAWTWHEAADARVFHPIEGQPCEGDLVWVGNWGDDERADELREFLLDPVRQLGLKARVYGVRYPQHARDALRDAGIEFGGWLANFDAPKVLARFKVTVHVPRRPYVQALPGIPTIRVFESLACGIPLVSAPWRDAERLFAPGDDYLVACNGRQMKRHLRRILDEPRLARQLAAHGRRTVLARHTCAHRADQLMQIISELNAPAKPDRKHARKTARRKEKAWATAV